MKERESRLLEIKEKKLKQSDEDNAIFTIHCEIVGKIVAEIDDIIGLVEKQVVMLSGSDSTTLQQQYFPTEEYDAFVDMEDE